MKQSLNTRVNNNLLSSGKFVKVTDIKNDYLISKQNMESKIKRTKTSIYLINRKRCVSVKSIAKLITIEPNEKKRKLMCFFMLDFPELDEIQVYHCLGITMKKPEYFIFESKMNKL